MQNCSLLASIHTRFLCLFVYHRLVVYKRDHDLNNVILLSQIHRLFACHFSLWPCMSAFFYAWRAPLGHFGRRPLVEHLVLTLMWSWVNLRIFLSPNPVLNQIAAWDLVDPHLLTVTFRYWCRTSEVFQPSTYPFSWLPRECTSHFSPAKRKVESGRFMLATKECA